MAQRKNITGLADLPLKCISEPNPMFSIRNRECGKERTQSVPQRLSLRISSPAAVYPHESDVPHGAKAAQPQIHSGFCHRA